MPAPVFLLPESAPFTAEQRAWLSGVFAATLLTDAQGAIGRLLQSDLRASDAPKAGEALLRAWATHRIDASESFQAFTARHEIETLKRLAEQM